MDFDDFLDKLDSLCYHLINLFLVVALIVINCVAIYTAYLIITQKILPL